MKKLVTPGFAGRLCAFFAMWVVLLLSNPNPGMAQNCIMTCPPMEPPVEVSLPSSCTDELTYNEIGVILVNCPGLITVDILENGNSIGNTINADMIGNTYMVIVSHPSSGQSCMMMITVVDNLAPIVTCPDDVTLECTTDLSQYDDLDPESDIDDCSTIEVFMDDQLDFYGMCQNNLISRYIRTYTVIDAYQNISTCEQIISLEKASLGDVEFPVDLTGLDALDCAPPPDTSPESTGYPSVNGDNIVNGNFCNLSAGFSDIVVDLCSGSYKIFRAWTVIDWCTNSQLPLHTQIIEVLDKTPPVVTAPVDMTISTTAHSCLGNALVPAAAVTDDCSDIDNIWMNTPVGSIQSNGGFVNGLPVGVHQIIFYAITDCGLVGSDVMNITVQDLQPPTPICHAQLVVPLNNEGTSTIPAHIFNAASTDNCSSVYFKVRRMSLPAGYICANPGNPNNLFDDYVQLCCADIANNNIMIVLRVYDVQPVPGPVADNYLQGHYNDCMIQVEVQDKLPPQIICPSNLTISCEFPFTPENLDVFGTVALTEESRELICIDDPGDPWNQGLHCIGRDGLATDNCSVDVSSTASIDINMCGVGTITRIFTATDDGGLTTTCTQVISVINYDLFDVSQITWPQDLTTSNICEIGLLDPDDLAFPYSEPILDDGPCDMVAATYDDDVYDFSNNDQACFKILRTWTVIDWCQLNSGYGMWSHIQVIKVMNNEAPVIEPLEDLTACSFDPECGGLELDFEAEAQDDCSGPNSLSWRYYIDLNNNASFEVTSQVVLGSSVSFSYEMPIGTHRLLFTVWDQCGNSAIEEQLVTIESCKPPSAKCIHGLSTNLMAMDMDGNGEPDWGMVVIQAEMFDAGSDHPCGNPVTVAFSADPQDVSRVFDCSDIGDNEIELWAIDQNGLTDFCITTIDIQDNNGICPPGLGGAGVISGNISVPNSGKLSGTMVYLDGSNHSGTPTSSEGYFTFPSMPFGGEYIVRPVRDGDDRNGVTTLDLVKIQKHLLGLETFTSPFQYIAADANNSEGITALDILQLRKLILGTISELPNNSSWRFIDDAHIFADVHNPWASDWAETYSIIPFSTNMTDVDFDAVKVGDINLSANLSLTGSPILPRTDDKCLISYHVNAQPEQDVYRVDLYLQDASKYEAIQFSFDWDQKGYTLLDWESTEWITAEDIRMPVQTGESASLSSFTVNSWPEGDLPILTMWVRRNSQLAYPFQIFLKAGPTQALAYSLGSEDEIRVQLVEGKNDISTIQNRPNPFRDMTTIVMKSDREEKADLRIYDLNGKLIFTKTIQLIHGDNEIVVQRYELKNPGMYVFELESSFQYRTNRMILVE